MFDKMLVRGQHLSTFNEARTNQKRDSVVRYLRGEKKKEKNAEFNFQAFSSIALASTKNSDPSFDCLLYEPSPTYVTSLDKRSYIKGRTEDADVCTI